MTQNSRWPKKSRTIGDSELHNVDDNATIMMYSDSETVEHNKDNDERRQSNDDSPCPLPVTSPNPLPLALCCPSGHVYTKHFSINPFGGHVCLQLPLDTEGYHPLLSRKKRNVDAKDGWKNIDKVLKIIREEECKRKIKDQCATKIFVLSFFFYSLSLSFSISFFSLSSLSLTLCLSLHIYIYISLFFSLFFSHFSLSLFCFSLSLSLYFPHSFFLESQREEHVHIHQAVVLPRKTYQAHWTDMIKVRNPQSILIALHQSNFGKRCACKSLEPLDSELVIRIL